LCQQRAASVWSVVVVVVKVVSAACCRCVVCCCEGCVSSLLRVCGLLLLLRRLCRQRAAGVWSVVVVKVVSAACCKCVVCCCEGCVGSVLQVCGLPSGLPCSQLDSYLSDLVVCFSARRFDVVRDSWHVTSSPPAADTVDGCCVLALFDSDDAALTALTYHSSAKYRLQPYIS